MRLSQLIKYLQDALVVEGDIPVVNDRGDPLTFVVAEHPDPVDPLRPQRHYTVVRTYADSR